MIGVQVNNGKSSGSEDPLLSGVTIEEQNHVSNLSGGVSMPSQTHSFLGSMTGAQHLVDLSHEISEGMPVFPGDVPIQLARTHEFRDNGYTNHRWATGMHVGTHLDTPMHMSEDERFVKDVPLQRLLGPAALLDVRAMAADGKIDWRPEFGQLMQPSLVLWTGWDRFYGEAEYYEHPQLTLEFAKGAFEAGVRLLAMDMPSPDRSPFPVHTWLFARDVLLVENLTNLERLAGATAIGFAAIPLKLKTDGSPVRAFGWSLASSSN